MLHSAIPSANLVASPLIISWRPYGPYCKSCQWQNWHCFILQRLQLLQHRQPLLWNSFTLRTGEDLQAPASHMDANYCPGCSTNHSLILAWKSSIEWPKLLVPRSHVEDWEEALAPGFIQAQFQPLWPSGEWVSKWKMFFFSSLYKSGFQIIFLKNGCRKEV